MHLFNPKIVVPPIASNHLKPIAVFLRARSCGPTLSLHIFDPSLPNLTFLSFPFISPFLAISCATYYISCATYYTRVMYVVIVHACTLASRRFLRLSNDSTKVLRPQTAWLPRPAATLVLLAAACAGSQRQAT